MSSITTSSIDTLVAQYMQLERQPLNRLSSQKTTLDSKNTLFDALQKKLEGLQTLVDDLQSTESDNPLNAVNASTSDADKLEVSASDGATSGTYAFRVRQLATSTSMKSSGNLNTSNSAESSGQVVPGVNELDTYQSFADAGFDSVPTGSVSFKTSAGFVTFDLEDYDTVDDFLQAVNDDATAGVNIYYDENVDRFVIEADEPGDTLSIRQSEDNGFFTQAKIADPAGGNIITDTATYSFSTSNSGVQSDVLLYKANFDTDIEESDTGSFKINGVTIEWDADEDSLSDIITAINSSQAGVTAFYDNTLDKITFTANETGSEAIQYSDVEGSFLSDVLKLDGVTQDVGQDAKFTINSNDIEDEITKSSNTFSINGLNVTLKQTTVAAGDYSNEDTETVTISSNKDVDAVTSKIESFVAKFNDVLNYLEKQTAVDPDNYTRGALAGDASIRGLRSTLINTIVGQVTGLNNNDPVTMAEVGLTFNEDMQLEISDSSALEDAISDNALAVVNIFNAEDGIATTLYNALDSYTDDVSGIIEMQRDVLQEQLDTIDKQMDRYEERLAVKEEQYRSQLSQLQSLLYAAVQQQNLMKSITAQSNEILGL